MHFPEVLRMSSVINETKELLDRKNIKNSPTCQQPEALP